MSEMYQKLDPREHVLKRPGMYIGSVRPDVFDAFVYTGAEIVQRSVRFSPGFATVFDEVLNNAIDHAWRPGAGVKNIKVAVDGDAISVWNDGAGIPVEVHAATGLMVPELIFGNMLTSSNYDDSQERTVGGQNGVGAKSTNIFSAKFAVETCDGTKRYAQEWTDNMQTVSKPRITAAKRAPYTCVRFVPDYARFGMKGLDAAAESVILKRAADACAVTPPAVTVAINGEKLPYKSFERYVDLYIGPKSGVPRYHEKVNDDWEVCVCASPDGAFRQVAFVNGICTAKGGKHVDHAVAAIAKRVADALAKKRAVKPHHVKSALWIFLRCTVPNPTFDSQTKDFLTSPVASFRRKFECSQAFIDKLARGAVGEKALAQSKAADDSSLKKTDGKMRSTVAVPKLEDAHWAGTAKSHLCTLVLTEGDSAKTMAVSGLAVVGRDRFGVFPLKGKLLNTRDAAAAKIAANDEITAIKKIMGLETGKVYKDAADTRYGSILVLADQDVDGFHIRGLLFNLFQSMWPSLFNTPGFLTSMLTPVVRAFPKPGGGPVRNFYNMPDFERYMDAAPSHARVKYYKGLGTSTTADAKEYFRDMKRVVYTHETVQSDSVKARLAVDDRTQRVALDLVVDSQTPEDAMDMAFNKARANDRKEWLRRYDAKVLDYTKTTVPFVEFVNKELRLFSLDDLARSIPSAVDGLKTSQRKIVYACKLRPRNAGELRVAQLAGFVSEKAAYHHGEASLQNTIIGLAQAYVGSNNLPLLEANGQFGSRLTNGKDAASARYIYTDARKIVPLLIPDRDEPVLRRALDDDRNPVEPIHYAPLLPLVLVNGANGIGTGFSTNVPKFNPRELADAYLRMLDGGDAPRDLTPWYKGFTGDVIARDGKWVSRGVFKKSSPTTVEIHELPIGTWTSDYLTWLEEKSGAKRVEAYHTESIVKFVAHFEPAALAAMDIEQDLHLVSDKGLSTNNMYLFDHQGNIKLYDSIADIAADHFRERLRVYARRKEHEIKDLGERTAVLSTKAMFIRDVIAGDLVLNNAPEGTLDAHARARAWTPLDGAFDYLAKMPMASVTAKRYQALLRERDDVVAALAKLRATDPRDMFRSELLELKRVL